MLPASVRFSDNFSPHAESYESPPALAGFRIHESAHEFEESQIDGPVSSHASVTGEETL